MTQNKNIHAYQQIFAAHAFRLLDYWVRSDKSEFYGFLISRAPTFSELFGFIVSPSSSGDFTEFRFSAFPTARSCHVWMKA
jgi:hypothetical protein